MIKKIEKFDNESNLVILGTSESSYERFGLNETEIQYLKQQIEDKVKQIVINQYKRIVLISIVDTDEDESFKKIERVRESGNKAHHVINIHKLKSFTLVHAENNNEEIFAFTEGIILTNYQFLKYLQKPEDKKFSLETVNICCNCLEKDLNELNTITQAVYYARDLVNEPLSYLTAVKLSEEIKKMSEEAGFQVEVMNKNKIEALKFGGLLAVNKGSIDPPTFSIIEWMPENALNEKPIVLVGKGVVFDTGGLSLKPTPNSMDEMKSDMAGAASVIGALFAIAKSKLPVQVVGLIPATDNRPDGNAYVPGDIITMHNGMTVEVMNTDAEGRMILADALSYAQKYDPELIIDVATLTGSAVAAVGKYGIVGMGNAEEDVFEKIKQSGKKVHERIVQFPFWDEYGELMKSDIADLKNLGGKDAGAITAGKFLENFTDYPFIHLDIAGPSFLQSNDKYRTKGGSGTAVRLLFDFIRNFYK